MIKNTDIKATLHNTYIQIFIGGKIIDLSFFRYLKSNYTSYYLFEYSNKYYYYTDSKVFEISKTNYLKYITSQMKREDQKNNPCSVAYSKMYL